MPWRQSAAKRSAAARIVILMASQRGEAGELLERIGRQEHPQEQRLTGGEQRERQRAMRPAGARPGTSLIGEAERDGRSPRTRIPHNRSVAPETESGAP